MVTALDARYGRTADRRHRRRVLAIVAGAVLVVGVGAWGLWTGFGGSATSLETATTDLTVRGPGSTDVEWTVTGRPSTTLVCAIEAQDASGVVVGLVEVTVPPTGRALRGGTTTVRTVRQATTGLIASCRDA